MVSPKDLAKSIPNDSSLSNKYAIPKTEPVTAKACFHVNGVENKEFTFFNMFSNALANVGIWCSVIHLDNAFIFLLYPLMIRVLIL